MFGSVNPDIGSMQLLLIVAAINVNDETIVGKLMWLVNKKCSVSLTLNPS